MFLSLGSLHWRPKYMPDNNNYIADKSTTDGASSFALEYQQHVSCCFTDIHLIFILTECNAKLLIIYINNISQLKGGVDLCCLLQVWQGHLVIVLLNALGWSTLEIFSSNKQLKVSAKTFYMFEKQQVLETQKCLQKKCSWLLVAITIIHFTGSRKWQH